MMLRARRILGLNIEEHSILAAELRITDGKREVKYTAEFDFPEGLSLQEPDRLGKALMQFLRQNRFSAKRAVVGIPAKWLMVKQKDIPPASAESVAGILRIQAERDFSLDLKDVVLDYAGEGESVLLVATLHRKVDQVVAMAQAAGLSVQSITSSAMALASATGQSQSAPGLMLHLKPDGAELTARSGGQFRLLRHLPLAPPAQSETSFGAAGSWIAALYNDVRRVVSLLPGGEAWQEPDQLLIWDGIGLDPSAVGTLGERLSLGVKVSESLSDLGVTHSLSACEAEGCRFAAAVALGLTGFQPGLLPIDFLHSRLALRKKTAFKRRALWAACVAATLVVACLSVLLDWQKDKEEVAVLKNRLEEMSEDLEAAKGVIEKVSLARGWHDGRPRFLDCLRELTLRFPEEGRTWATNLAVREDMRGIVSGKSVDEKSVLEVFDTLKDGGTFSDVKLLYMRQAGTRSPARARGGGHEVSFAISFIFVDTE